MVSFRFCLGLAILALLTGCSVRQLAMNKLGDALSGGGGSVFTSDDDPELIKDALPFSLKLMESVLAETPEHEELLLGLASSYTQYAYGFVQLEADMIEDEDYDAAEAKRQRAKKLYLRAKGYGLRALEVRHPGIGTELAADPDAAVAGMKAEDVPYLYWTAASWAAAVALSLDDPELIGDLAMVSAIADKALELDPDWEQGTLQSFFITYTMSRLDGEGDPLAKANAHYRRALELTGGHLVSVHVAYAESIAVDQQDKEGFVKALETALAVDVDAYPDQRLANLIYQRKARWLLTRLDWLFL